MRNARRGARRQRYPTAADWFEKAEEDFAFAKAGFHETGYYSLVLFHCQQAVEKALKAYLTHAGKRFGKIHFLTSLLKQAMAVDRTFREFLDECRSLDKYYIVTRYPVDWTAIYTQAEAKRGLGQAEDILKFVEQKIG